MFNLPISGLSVSIRPPTGAEDLLLQEAWELDAGTTLQLFKRLVRCHSDPAPDWRDLAVPDYEALLLLVRRVAIGDLIRAETNCNVDGCGARADVSFRTEEYLASQKPHTPRGVKAVEGSWFFGLAGQDVQFRLPNFGDLLAMNRQVEWEQELFRRCVKPPDVSASVRRRIDRAMESLGPRLSRTLAGECPECHAGMNFYFDVPQFVLRDLRDHAAMVFEDIHLLTLHYKWSQKEILALPRSRRARYAEALRNRSSAT